MYIDFRSDHSVVQRDFGLSMLNSHPYSHAVYASQHTLPHTTQNSLPVPRLTACRVGVPSPLCVAPFRAHGLTPRCHSYHESCKPHPVNFLFISKIKRPAAADHSHCLQALWPCVLILFLIFLMCSYLQQVLYFLILFFRQFFPGHLIVPILHHTVPGRFGSNGDPIIRILDSGLYINDFGVMI